MKSAALFLKQKSYDYWLKKNWYYHQFFKRFYQFMIPEDSKVLQVSCKNGFLLSAVSPSVGVGIDEDEQCILDAQHKYPHYQFYSGTIKQLSIDETFDYIILSSATMETDDIQELLTCLQRFCHQDTRLIIDSYSLLWEPILWLTQKLHLRRPTPLKNWISRTDLKNFLHLSDFEVITQGRQLLIPCYLPIISWFGNSLLALVPGINALCLSEWLIARPKQQKKDPQEFSVSIIIPCKNERGNIEPAVKQCPSIGKWTELIFVDGHSQDGTVEEMKRVMNEYPEKNIKFLIQDGTGKGAGVRKGFAHAQGDVLMIQDGDLTAPPEELSKFYQALIDGKGDFINGSRLVYGMESGAMRFLNLIVNYCFGIGFSWILGQSIKDTLCGTKVVFKKDYEKIVKNRSFFGDFDPYGDFDLLFGSAKQNLKIIDMPVHYKKRTYGTSQISRFQGGWLLLKMWLVAFKKFKIR